MLTVKGVLVTLLVVWIAAMIVWDWSSKPDAIILPRADDDDDEWHDWPHAL